MCDVKIDQNYVIVNHIIIFPYITDIMVDL